MVCCCPAANVRVSGRFIVLLPLKSDGVLSTSSPTTDVGGE